MEILTEFEAKTLTALLNSKQADFLHLKIQQKRKSRWLTALSTYKGIHINKKLSYEQIIELLGHWELIEINDSGKGNKFFKCECGHLLRIEFVVQNKKENKLYKLGETCFENYTGLSSEVIKDVINNQHQINLERDEILIKFQQNDFFPLNTILKSGVELPEDIIEQWNIGLPLTDKQIKMVKQLHRKEKRRQEIEQLLSGLNKKQQAYLVSLPENEYLRMIDTLDSGKIVDSKDISPLHISREIKEKCLLELPLNINELKEIQSAQEKLNRDKYFEEVLTNLNQEQRNWIKTFPLDEQLEIIKKVKKNHYLEPNTENLELSPELQTHLSLNLPLTNNQLKEINAAKREKAILFKSQTRIQKMTFELLMERHLETLKKVREKESDLSPGLARDWLTIRQICSELKNGGEFDYERFKLLMYHIVIATKVEKDEYL